MRKQNPSDLYYFRSNEREHFRQQPVRNENSRLNNKIKLSSIRAIRGYTQRTLGRIGN